MKSRRIVVVAFDGVQSLDVMGPVEVFSTTGLAAGEPLYAVEVVAPGEPTPIPRCSPG